MGNWNRRYGPRKKNFRNYQEPPPSPVRTQPYPYGRSENGVPSWEIDFCYSSGVLWQKVLTTKKYMFCHDSVVKWNDSAGEEAFHNAKRRYWEKINGLPCDPLPNSEMFIDKIDWEKIYVDPKLMLELDQEYFNPDEGQQSEKSDSKLEERSSCSLVQKDKSTHNGENPWESNLASCKGRLESFVDPWEQHYTEVAQAMNSNAWKGSGDGSWGWNTGQLPNAPHSPQNVWSQGCQGVEYVPMNGRGHVGYNSWSNNQWGNYHLPVNAAASIDKGEGDWRNNFPAASNDRRRGDWGNNSHAASNDRGWGDWVNNSHAASTGRGCDAWGNNSQGWERSEYINGGSRYTSFLGQSREVRAPYDGGRKREGTLQHVSRSKSSRFQANDHGRAYQWRK